MNLEDTYCHLLTYPNIFIIRTLLACQVVVYEDEAKHIIKDMISPLLSDVKYTFGSNDKISHMCT